MLSVWRIGFALHIVRYLLEPCLGRYQCIESHRKSCGVRALSPRNTIHPLADANLCTLGVE